MSGDGDDELTRLALEELEKSAKRGKERCQTMGALGWGSRGRPKANKRYLHSTLLEAVKTNKRMEQHKPLNQRSGEEKKKYKESTERINLNAQSNTKRCHALNKSETERYSGNGSSSSCFRDRSPVNKQRGAKTLSEN